MDWIFEKKEESPLSHLCFLKNTYPINVNITTYDTLSEDEHKDIRANIIQALYDATNANEIEFGERISVDYITDVIINCDGRIKSAYLDGINYTTQAVYYDEYDGVFKEVTLGSDASLTRESQGDTQSVLAHRFEKK